jgi:hypothetical protein
MSNDETVDRGRDGYDPRELYAKGLIVGQSDLVVGASTKQVIGRTAAFSLFLSGSRDGRPTFRGITVVAPPQVVWPETDDQILEIVLEGINYLRSIALNSAEITAVRRRLTIQRCGDLSVAELLSQVEEAAATERQFILVPMAHIYADPALEKAVSHGRTSVILSEDYWVPQVVAWVPTCIRAIKATNGYLVIDVPEFPPASPEHRQRLIDVEDLIPVYVGYKGQTDPGALIQANAPHWTMLALTGRMDEALQEIEALDIDEAFKRQLEIQILSRGSDIERTLHALRAFDGSGQAMPPELVVRFGRIAHQSGDDVLASRLIGAGIDAILSQPILEAAMRTCERLNDPDLEARAYRRLVAVFPTSAEIQDYHERVVITLCAVGVDSHADGAARPIPLPAFETKLIAMILDDASRASDLLDVANHAASARERDLILLSGATRALACGESDNAIALASKVSNHGNFHRRACSVLLAAMRRRLLDETGPYDAGTPFGESLAYVRNFIATHPGDAELREAFASSFTVNLSASVGLPILAAQALDLASQGLDVAPPSCNGPEAEQDELVAFLKRATAWVRRIPGLEVGFTKIPLEVIGGNPTAMLNALGRLIRHMAHSQVPGDLEEAERLSFFACLIARYVPNAYLDINALKMIANRLIQEGRSQRARDLAEQILQLAGESRIRQRLAWAAYADIYHRVRSPVDALVGLNCAFALKEQIEADDAWWEAYTLLRVARDLGLTPLASHVLESLKTLQTLMPEGSLYEARLESLELSLRLLDQRQRSVDALKRLTDDAERHCRNLLGSREEQLPAISLLAQAMGFLEEAGGSPSAAAQDLLHEALASLESPQAELVRAVATMRPTIEGVVAMRGRVEQARYADDVPGDLVAIEVLVRRLLREVAMMSPAKAACAMELLADHGLDSPGARAIDMSWPLPLLAEMRPSEGAILMVALDADGALVVLTVRADDTKIEKVATEGPSFRRRLAKWSENYPYQYGKVEREEGNNIFFQTMEELPIPLPAGRRIVVIGEPGLQLIPLNLLLVDNNFAGSSRAMAFVPSLTWLDAIGKHPRTASTQRIAWLSEARQEGKSSAIEMVLNVTRETLTRAGFELSTSTSVPEGLSEAQIAVVTAHGSVAGNGKYFHRISDEGELALTPRALASAVGGAELVILFVCSAGRADPHPFLNTAVGLPKLLLVAGSRTVIASPWPLSSPVTGPWLEAFMEAWEAGEMALDANFIANTAVDTRYGYVPQYSLAMTVYGDPYLRKHA